MSTRGARRASRRGRRATLAAFVILAAASLAACGAKNFPNDPRPPSPIDVTAKVDSKRVVVSPAKFGAGLVNFDVANLSASPVRVKISGPKDAESNVIQPGSPTVFTVQLPEGRYLVTGGRAGTHPATVSVGPERPSSQNKLLLP